MPEAISLVSYPVIKVHCNTWSLTNRVLVWIGGTRDARGWRQWHEVGRMINHGSKAIYLLVFFAWKALDKDLGQERLILQRFFTRPVLRVEDTEGNPL
jgi:hypothetical protein